MKNGKHTDAGGSEYWYQNGQLHREDGPAVRYADGEEGWYLNGKKLSESEVLIRKEGIEFDNMMRELLTVGGSV